MNFIMTIAKHFENLAVRPIDDHAGQVDKVVFKPGNQLLGAAVIRLAAAVVSALSLSAPLAAMPMRLECSVKSEAADSTSAARVIAMTFDGETNTLLLSQSARDVKFENVTSTNVSINGNTKDMSVGIDRSSWSIVLQTYSEEQVSNEFGTCRMSTLPDH